MAHDVRFTSMVTGEKFYFFGYAEGIVYDAFDAQRFNNGVSGSNEGKWVSRETVKEAMEIFHTDPRAVNYPDPRRFPDLISNLNKWLDKNEERLSLHFS